MNTKHQIIWGVVLIILVGYASLIGYGMCNTDGLFC